MSTQSVLEYASRKIGGVPRLPPVVGGTGRRYWTVADALAGESGQAVTVAGVVPQAGTQAGVVVFQAGQSAVDGFYKDQYVLDTDAAPTNGLVSQWGRVSNYVGATRTATLDKPWDFSAEHTVAIIQPARIALEEDVTEDVSVTIPLELDLQGHRITGKVDITAGNFCWIRGGSGLVTNGVQKTDFGLLKVDDCTVSRRDATIYAILMTEASNLGRCELKNVQSEGRVSGRRGFSGWAVYGCRNIGVPSNAGFDELGFTLVESVAGVAVVVSAFDLEVESEFGGAFFYSENNLTGPAAYVSVLGRIQAAKSYFSSEPTPQNASLMRAVGSATCTLTAATGAITFTFDGFHFLFNQSKQAWVASLLSVVNFTGTATLTINSQLEFCTGGSSIARGITVEGASNMTGTVTMNGSAAISWNNYGDVTADLIALEGPVTTGSVTFGIAVTITGGFMHHMSIRRSQTVGAPALTCSANVVLLHSNFPAMHSFSGGITVSVGTYVVSGQLSIYETNVCQIGGIISIASVVTGGTFTVSSSAINGDIGSGANGNFIIVAHAGGGGTVNVSSATVSFYGDRFSNGLSIVRCTGTAGSVTVSGAVLLNHFTSGAGLNNGLAVVTVGAQTAAVTGSVTISYCRLEGAYTLCATTSATGTVQGPSAIIVESCFFESTLVTSAGAGTLTWASAALTFRHCAVDGLLTVVATPFTTLQAFHTRFNGNSGNNSVTASGSAPTTYRYWKCSFLAIVAGLNPEIINDYTVVPANAALTRGNLMSINSATNAIAALASSVVEGVLLAAAGGAGSPAILVRRGRVFVSSDAAVVAGDSCVLDTVTTPTNQIKGAAVVGQRTGRALEAAGATIAGLAYTEVNLM